MDNILTVVLIGIVAIAVVALLYALPTMLLWNWLMPFIFGLPKLTFFQSMGLTFLAGLLFKSTVATK